MAVAQRAGPVCSSVPAGEQGVDDPEAITRWLQATPPSCVDGFRLLPAELPIEWAHDTRSCWRLMCRCDGAHGRILGYRLEDYSDSYAGADLFVSPIGFECITCGRTTDVIDTKRHGYHAELAAREGGVGSAKYRGAGPRAAWRCPRCGGERFGLTVAFIFWDAVLDLADDEPGWPLQDFFNVFLSFAECVGCGHRSEPTDFGKL